jgi:GNAT superfamily N-acetyltransferase
MGAFAAQREPLAAWQSALRGDAPYRMHVRLALEGDDVRAGITYELYPRSQCGLVTYMVVAPEVRAQGLGRSLFEGAAAALYGAGARAVFGEVNDPRVHGDVARPRLERFVRWGARVLDVAYVQPSLGPGLARDTGLVLIVLPPAPPVGEDVVRAFVEELYEATEGGKPGT